VTLAFALAAAVLFGTGAYLLLSRDLVRVVAGVVLVSQSAVLTLIASSLTRGRAPIHPLPDAEVSDPLTQAMALTALVIGLAVIALLLALVHRVAWAFRTRRLDEVAAEEAEEDERLERADEREREQEEEAAL
jgi:multicomponent Na+:H+ antiporter subunit C